MSVLGNAAALAYQDDQDVSKAQVRQLFELADQQIAAATGGSSNVATDITQAPAFVGQRAVSGGEGYIALGTSAASDWAQIT